MKSELNKLFIKHFCCIEDPRIGWTKRHQLLDILALGICAVLSGAEQWIAIEAYGQEKVAWLKTFLELPNGIPSHDTIARVFARINPTQFQKGGSLTQEKRYYISSLPMNAPLIANAIRAHWRIENNLH